MNGAYNGHMGRMRFAIAATLGLVVVASFSVASSAFSQRTTARPAPRTARAVPRVNAAVPFKVGETLTYEVSWSSFVVAGTAVTTVKERKPSFNSSAYYIVVEGRPVPLVARLYSLYYKMDTLLDSYVLLSQRGSFYSEEGSKHRFNTTRFDRTARRAFFEEKTDTTVAVDFAVPPQTQDALAAFYALRGRAFKTGDRWTVPVADSGALYTTQVEVGAIERVTVPLGEMDAWKLNLAITDAAGERVWKDIAIWVSNDARRLPVKMQAELPVGAFVLALREAS